MFFRRFRKKKAVSRYRTMICREGVYYLVSISFVFLAAMLRQVNPMLLFASLLICPLFLAWWMGRQTLLKLVIRRNAPGRIHAGDTFAVQMEIENPRTKHSSWAVVAEDSIECVESGLNLKQPVQRPAVYFEHVAPRGECCKKYFGRLPHRGRYKLGELTLSTRFPCGFFRSLRTISEPSEILVLPRVGKLSAEWTSRQHAATENQQRRRFLPSRVTGEFLGVRHWQQGDTKRLVHWRASARHDKLVVKQFEQHQNRDTAILLDLFQSRTSQFAEENIELAVSFAATLAIEVIRRGGNNLLFGTFQDKMELYQGAAAAPFLQQILDRLAVIKPASNDFLVELLLEALANTDPNTDLILISSEPVALNHPTRFQTIKNDPRLRVLTQRLRMIDTSDNGFIEHFEV